MERLCEQIQVDRESLRFAAACPICGKKRRERACTCEEDEKDKKEIDPRLAKLQKLLENPEKV